MNAEMRERGRIAGDLDKALLRLDLDGLRFVLCIALVRSMTPSELDKVVERLQISGSNPKEG